MTRQTITSPADKGCARRFAQMACPRHAFGLGDVGLLVSEAGPTMLLVLFAMRVLVLPRDPSTRTTE